MEKICWENSNYDDSNIIIAGIPDEFQSRSLREGTSKAPQQIRKISNTWESYTRKMQKTLGYPMNGISKNIFDYGDIKKQQISEIFEKIFSDSKNFIDLNKKFQYLFFYLAKTCSKMLV